MNRALPTEIRTIFVVLLMGAALVVAAAYAGKMALDDPRISFLCDTQNAQWITIDKEVHLRAQPPVVNTGLFRRKADVTQVVEHATITVTAFKSFTVDWDGRRLFESSPEPEDWKRKQEIRLPSPLPSGPHELVIGVKNRAGPLAVLVETKLPGFSSGSTWEASDEGQNWFAAWPASRTKSPLLSDRFPTTLQAVTAIAAILVPVFLLACWVVLYNGRATLLSISLRRFTFTPDRLRTTLHWLWMVLALNNTALVYRHVGFDFLAHLDYIQFVAEKWTLPLATDGWQMFQSPLYYMLTAPIYALLADFLPESSIAHLLRLLSFGCGLAQVEIAYRSAKHVFPRRDDLQMIATTVGGLTPMSLYMSQAVSNEPLAGCLTALTVLMVLPLLTQPEIPRSWKTYALIGGVWGLALLTKVTPVLLAPLLLIAILYSCWKSKESVRSAFLKSGLLFVSAFVVCGWYYLRNWIELGRPFVGGWDASRGIEWWQDPGYRTATHFTSFGATLIQPVYSGVHGFWDAVYSTLWLDGFLSGFCDYDVQPPWNVDMMIAGAILAGVPMLLIVHGAASSFCASSSRIRAPLSFAFSAIVLYLCAMLVLYLKLPTYSTSKASYMLGLLPCFALLAAAGARPLLKYRLPRAVLTGALTCWGVTAYLAYFVMPDIQSLISLFAN